MFSETIMLVCKILSCDVIASFYAIISTSWIFHEIIFAYKPLTLHIDQLNGTSYFLILIAQNDKVIWSSEWQSQFFLLTQMIRMALPFYYYEVRWSEWYYLFHSSLWCSEWYCHLHYSLRWSEWYSFFIIPPFNTCSM